MPTKQYHHLTDEDRRTITAMGMAGYSETAIAVKLGRSRSTINRERRRNACRDGHYRRIKATRRANARRKVASRRSHYTPEEWALIDRFIAIRWSPEQIAASLKHQGIVTISHQSIYRHIREDRDAGGSLYTHLRRSGKWQRKRYGKPEKRGKAPGKRSIEDRPASISRRRTRFHWEADTVMGAAGSKHCLVTLVERKTGFALIGKVKNRTATAVTDKIIELLIPYHDRIISVTCDNGTEFNEFSCLKDALGIEVYFTHPHAAWEKGSVENFNGLVRQYVAKGTCMNSLSQKRCNAITKELNDRPRKRLGYKTPAYCYLAS